MVKLIRVVFAPRIRGNSLFGFELRIKNQVTLAIFDFLNQFRKGYAFFPDRTQPEFAEVVFEYLDISFGTQC